jgi:hypothetical protein
MAETLTYVYHGKLFELRGSSVHVQPALELGAARYGRVAIAEFTMRKLADGAETAFAITYALDGALAEVPLTMSYQPRWWMQVNLVLDDENATTLAAGVRQ